MANEKNPELYNFSSGDIFSKWKQEFAWLTDPRSSFSFLRACDVHTDQIDAGVCHYHQHT